MFSLLFATVLASATFTQPLPFEVNAATISINGCVSNSLDPILSRPRSFSLKINVGSEPVRTTFRDKCGVKLTAQFDKYRHQVNFNVEHVHDVYDKWVDFIGWFEYKVKFDKYEILGKHFLKHVNRLERPIDIYKDSPEDPERRYDRATGLMRVFDINEHDTYSTVTLEMIPGRKYRLEFDYMVGVGSYNVKEIWLQANQYKDGLTTWSMDAKNSIRYQLNCVMQLQRFAKIIDAHDNNALSIRFGYENFNDNEAAGALFIRNAKLTPCLDKNLEKGP